MKLRSLKWRNVEDCIIYLRQGGNVFTGVCLFVCLQRNSKSCGRIWMTFAGNVCGVIRTRCHWLQHSLSALAVVCALRGAFLAYKCFNLCSVMDDTAQKMNP